jgi:hypothetical protein
MTTEPREGIRYSDGFSTQLSLSSLLISEVEHGSCEFCLGMERGKGGIREGCQVQDADTSERRYDDGHFYLS